MNPQVVITAPGNEQLASLVDGAPAFQLIDGMGQVEGINQGRIG